MAKEEEGKVSAPVYVIRAGKVRGQGKYLQSSMVGLPWGDAQSAARFDSREEAVDWLVDSREEAVDSLDPCSWSRVVAIVPRKVVSLAHHIVCVATARLAALEEAERVCLTQAKAWMAEINGGGAGFAAVHLASAIAALASAIAALKALP